MLDTAKPLEDSKKKVIEKLNTLALRLAPEKWDRFVLWLLSDDGMLGNVNPLPHCLPIVLELYRGRLGAGRHDADRWLGVSKCLSDVCIGQRHSPACDQRCRRRRVAGRFAASAGANAAFVYGAFRCNPQRYTSPAHLVISKMQAIMDACAACAWTSAPEGYKHRRHDSYLLALNDCGIEMEGML